MKIGVISDTHIRSIQDLSPDIVRALSCVDMIIHAGDFVHVDVLTGLQSIANVKAVCGNMDDGAIQDILPETEELSIHGKQIMITHGWGTPLGLETKLLQNCGDHVDIIIYGHTHQAKNERIGDTLFFNPGPGSRSYGILEVSDNAVTGKIVSI